MNARVLVRMLLARTVARARRSAPLRAASALCALAACGAAAQAQVIGPDMVNSNCVNVGRYGTDALGTTTAYAIGATTCNRGDLPAAVSTTTSIRPLVAQNMYRLKLAPGGQYWRFEQLGQGWVKRVAGPASGGNASCASTCTQFGSGYMGVGCADVYSSGFNGLQSLLGPRSMITAATGVSAGGAGTSVGDANTRGRIQVPTAEVVAQPAGTRFFAETIELLPDDAQYVRPGQTIAINAMNNATVQEINIAGGTGTPTLISPVQLVPALVSWSQVDPSVVVVTADHDETPNPNPLSPGTTIRCRYYAAAKATRLGEHQWRYEYVVYNLNSDRAGQALSLPMPDGASVSDVTFHHPPSHSGEPYSNAPWTAWRSGGVLNFATDQFTRDHNANALRWGTMYNFGFTTSAPPGPGAATLHLFVPGTPDNLTFQGMPVPQSPSCSPDFNGDTIAADDADIEAFFECLSGRCCPTCDPYGADFNGDGDVATDADIESFFRVLAGGSC